MLDVLRLDDDRLEDLLALAHDVRMKWCGPEVEVEGIISLKTGGCPEDCHFCSQSGLFQSPVRAAWLDIPSLVEAAKQTAKSGATEFCIVAAVRGPDARLLAQVAAGIEAIRNEVDIQIACSLGMLTQEQVDQLAAMGVHRYNHNLETSKSHFPERRDHAFVGRAVETRFGWFAKQAWKCAAAESSAWVNRWEQRAEFAANLAELEPDEVPGSTSSTRVRAPRSVIWTCCPPARRSSPWRHSVSRCLARSLRFAGGREITLGDLGAKQGILGGINAVIVGNYLTTLGRPAEKDLDLLVDLQMPIKALNDTL